MGSHHSLFSFQQLRELTSKPKPSSKSKTLDLWLPMCWWKRGKKEPEEPEGPREPEKSLGPDDDQWKATLAHFCLFVCFLDCNLWFSPFIEHSRENNQMPVTLFFLYLAAFYVPLLLTEPRNLTPEVKRRTGSSGGNRGTTGTRKTTRTRRTRGTRERLLVLFSHVKCIWMHFNVQNVLCK